MRSVVGPCGQLMPGSGRWSPLGTGGFQATPAKLAVLLAIRRFPRRFRASLRSKNSERSSISGNLGPGGGNVPGADHREWLRVRVRRGLRLRSATAGSDRRELHGDVPCDCHYASLPRDVVGVRATPRRRRVQAGTHFVASDHSCSP